ncbi:hypothetical protein [Actinoplanes subtropicus]|uniref:hypothetical protein n=1 Tax=Actinoplanes subtropicus TaxID=543632 RepID=UPI0004C33FCA|nr:hypothetical protein [Actinoplanes subtropicus]
MTSTLLAGIIAFLVLLFVLCEIASAVLPLIIVLLAVPERERETLARVLAALDSSRRLRLWITLRFAVTMRRQERAQARKAAAARDPRRNPYAHLNDYFAQLSGDAPLNHPYDRAETAKPSSPPV